MLVLVLMILVLVLLQLFVLLRDYNASLTLLSTEVSKLFEQHALLEDADAGDGVYCYGGGDKQPGTELVLTTRRQGGKETYQTGP